MRVVSGRSTEMGVIRRCRLTTRCTGRARTDGAMHKSVPRAAAEAER